MTSPRVRLGYAAAHPDAACRTTCAAHRSAPAGTSVEWQAVSGGLAKNGCDDALEITVGYDNASRAPTLWSGPSREPSVRGGT